jgi:hypothetical protein
MYKEATRRRESVDDSSAGYLLELAAKAAEKQLREQALAAFPNSDFHEPVAHYVDHDTEGSEPSVTEAKQQQQRESSFTQVNWDLVAMREYREKQIADKEKQKPKEYIKPAFSPFGNPAGFLDAATAKKFANERKDPELERQRKKPDLQCLVRISNFRDASRRSHPALTLLKGVMQLGQLCATSLNSPRLRPKKGKVFGVAKAMADKQVQHLHCGLTPTAEPRALQDCGVGFASMVETSPHAGRRVYSPPTTRSQIPCRLVQRLLRVFCHLHLLHLALASLLKTLASQV